MGERIGDFTIQTEKMVRRIQKEKCYLLIGVPIKVFHHEPARRELLVVGISPANIQFCLGLSLPGHAAIHYVRYDLFKDVDDRNACNGITPWMNEKECDLWDELVNGKDRRKIEELVLKRREKYLGGKIRS